jgi:type II secretory pathway component GspD/PulD (secretin)
MNGSLKAVLDNLSDAMGFFWSYEKGVLTVEPDRMFVVELPPVLLDDSLAGMSNTLVSLGARDPYLDRIARSLAFRANAKALEKIEKYLEQIRASRSLIVYQVQVYQVDLADVSTQGIQWNKLGGSNLDRPKLVQGSASPTPVSDLAKAFDLTRAASSLGVILAGPKFSLDVLIDFLKTQGTVKTVSQPRLAMLNGAKGTLRVGATATYVSKVGSNLSSGVSQVTAETRDLRTGLELSLVGEESDGTIYTRIALGLSELVRLNRFTTVGTDIALPEISDRDLQTVIRMPAGYTALLGGITITRNASDRSIGPVQNANNTEVKQSELVIVIRPTVVRFNTVAGAQPKAPPALPEMQPQSAPAAPPPAAPSRLTAQGELT